MSIVTVTTEQVHELIQQLAAMTTAASITPQMVANIFENMRQLNDQEREKVIATAEAYIAEIQNLGVSAEKVLLKDGSSLATTIDDITAKGYKFGGFVTPSSSPISGVEKYFYIATQNGTYVNFGGVILNDETAILYNADR